MSKDKNNIIPLFSKSKFAKTSGPSLDKMMDLAGEITNLINKAYISGDLDMNTISIVLATRLGESMRVNRIITGDDIFEKICAVMKDFNDKA